MMDVRSAGEALYIACEMEKRAIRLYERALNVFPDAPLQAAIREILQDERSHLVQFSRMGAAEMDFERGQLLSARAGRVLFSGGLVEAQRKGAFASREGLYAFAAEEEREAAGQYRAFAGMLSGGASDAFSAIALEEERHLRRLGELARESDENESSKG